jgi:hypothetical protein
VQEQRGFEPSTGLVPSLSHFCIAPGADDLKQDTG